MVKQQLAAMTAEEHAALIADCKADIARIERSLPCWSKTTYTLPYLQSQLKRQQIAMEALTAEPKTCDACIDVLSALGFNHKTARLKSVLVEINRLKNAPRQNFAPDDK